MLNKGMTNHIEYSEEMSAKDGILAVNSIEEFLANFDSVFRIINMVVTIVITLAAALAFVVLFTLSTTNISERERELATIKVLGFFDAEVHNVVKFDGETNVKDIKPVGRGGTNFEAVFKYIEMKMTDKLPSSIIILSDGDCEFPSQEASLGIPVLWVINNEKVNPPWGNITRIKEGEDY
jgi:hypothetical protein